MYGAHSAIVFWNTYNQNLDLIYLYNSETNVGSISLASWVSTKNNLKAK
jgi:hypothetical protein